MPPDAATNWLNVRQSESRRCTMAMHYRFQRHRILHIDDTVGVVVVKDARTPRRPLARGGAALSRGGARARGCETAEEPMKQRQEEGKQIDEGTRGVETG